MNDNRPESRHSEIQMTSGHDRFTIVFSSDANAELIETAARLLRAKPMLASIEMTVTNGGSIIAYRGERPGLEA